MFAFIVNGRTADPAVTAAGVSGIECLDPPPLGNVELAEAKARLGPAVFIKGNIDRLAPADGRGGRIRELIDGGYPVVLLTHWQSLYHRGTGLGLEGLTTLVERIQRVFGNSLQWAPLTEMAKTAMKV